MTTVSRLSPTVLEDLAQVELQIKGFAKDEATQEMRTMLAHVLDAPGKRLRPLLTVIASRFGEGNRELAVLMASAVELLHMATLLHDDMVDAATTRRGRATMNAKWGPHEAVLIGDYLFAASATLVCDTKNVRVIRRFAQTIMDLSSGQLQERINSYNAAQTREQYWQRISGKTASLFATSLESGSILGGAKEPVVQALKSYGYNLGMAFQVVDDILDFEGDPEELGKPVGEDLANGVLTLPAIMLLERYPKDTCIRDYCQDHTRKDRLRASVEMVRGSGIIRDAYQVATEFRDNAVAALANVPAIPERGILQEVTSFVIQRKK
ncbi:MAG: polyprenyl synthetase family protein [Dehalococcoidia bacterium]|nr:polyprenyl synthetase family protein [Dehalococcoidia bacterium]